MKFHLTIMRPDSESGRFYVQAFHEVIECLAYSLSALGYDVSYKANVFVPGEQNIVLGAQFADPKTPFPDGTVLYNLEQLGGNPMHLISPELIKRYRIWDHSIANLLYWKEHDVAADYVPIGFCSQLSRIAPVNYPDLDVLFFGAISPRRKKVIAQLLEMPDIKFHLGVGFGKERDPLIARAKVILNMHYYEQPQLFEQVRVSYLLANRKCIICETSDDFPPALDGAVHIAPYYELAETCRTLVHDVEQRLHYQQRGYELFSKLREVDILRPVVARLSAA